MTVFTRKQDSLVVELTMTMLTFNGTAAEIYDHLKSVFADPTLTQEDRDLMPEIILQAFGTGAYILQDLRNREGFEAVNAHLQLVAAQWALRLEQDAAGDG
ncbi:hypothetical protein [Rathayibacter festucae]|uniref:Uncharacterized protein n=1 Tax=Rathayibacter festucae DSM 15932 TaxID=1328866 RepID=A0A3T0T1X0_9MICO|nr:hypothetical protein [Rathayibacter festucae]AZZ52618.1 hypothetical protein C1I64_11585 [Rathayibacter festucae DSM 15932]